ncbi:MAG: hypothetical protein JRE64_11180 [Deltaproteobacteria bacterium]|nr:hypothetical protein [Deltaproteobacteria bacterium]
MDEETGAAGYMICGGLHGDNDVLSGGSLTQIVHNLVHLYEKILTLIKVIVIGGEPISVGLRLLKAVLMIMLYMDQLIVLPIIAYPLAAFCMIIGIAFIYIVSCPDYCFRGFLCDTATKNTGKRICLRIS